MVLLLNQAPALPALPSVPSKVAPGVPEPMSKEPLPAPSSAVIAAWPEAVSENGIMIGNPDAPVTIKEYTSFLCPACGKFALTVLPRIENDYIKTGKVKMVVTVLPPYELGWAALCSQEQEKFLVFSGFMFAHQKQITGPEVIRGLAIGAGLDVQKFDVCFSSGERRAKADGWAKEAEARKIFSIPAFFINGEKFVGTRPYEEFQKIIDEKLVQVPR